MVKCTLFGKRGGTCSIESRRRELGLCALQVLLLDEVTVDLDVVARMDLLNFFVQECNQVGHPDKPTSTAGLFAPGLKRLIYSTRFAERGCLDQL